LVSPVGDHKIACSSGYESVFPNFVRRFAANGAQVLFTISTTAGSARPPHAGSTWKSCACAPPKPRWILRAANDGITPPSTPPAGRSTLPFLPR